MSRVYSAGRDTGRWTRGERITDFVTVQVGDTLYMVSHGRYASDGLIRVSGPSVGHQNSFYFRWLDSDLTSRCGDDHLLWDYEFKNGKYDLYKVVADMLTPEQAQ